MGKGGVDAAARGAALLFVHGAAIKFEQAVRRASQMKVRLALLRRWSSLSVLKALKSCMSFSRPFLRTALDVFAHLVGMLPRKMGEHDDGPKTQTLLRSLMQTLDVTQS